MTLLRVEFHCHTIYSKDCLARLEHILATCRRRKIQRLVITDHNTITGAVEAQKIDPELVIVGEEIKTQSGELLAAFVRQEIPAGLPAMEAIQRLRDQDAYISVSHPFDRLRNGHWELADLEKIAPHVDAIEIFNSRCMLASFNELATKFAALHQIAGTVGSDSHSLAELGAATLLLPEFTDAPSLRQAIKSATYRKRLSGAWVHFVSSYARYQKEKARTS